MINTLTEQVALCALLVLYTVSSVIGASTVVGELALLGAVSLAAFGLGFIAARLRPEP